MTRREGGGRVTGVRVKREGNRSRSPSGRLSLICLLQVRVEMSRFDASGERWAAQKPLVSCSVAALGAPHWARTS